MGITENNACMLLSMYIYCIVSRLLSY